MSERQISVGDWNEQGLLPVTFEHAEAGGHPKKYIFRLSPEESRELEQLLHAANDKEGE